MNSETKIIYWRSRNQSKKKRNICKRFKSCLWVITHRHFSLSDIKEIVLELIVSLVFFSQAIDPRISAATKGRRKRFQDSNVRATCGIQVSFKTMKHHSNGFKALLSSLEKLFPEVILERLKKIWRSILYREREKDLSLYVWKIIENRGIRSLSRTYMPSG